MEEINEYKNGIKCCGYEINDKNSKYKIIFEEERDIIIVDSETENRNLVNKNNYK